MRIKWLPLIFSASIVGILIITCSFIQTSNEVLVYEIDIPQEPFNRLFKGSTGKINSTKKGYKLSTNQTRQLLKIINDTLTYGARHSYSHSPTVGFVFYNGNKVSDWIEVGLMTNTLRAKKSIKAQEKYFEFWRPVNEGDDPLTYELNGLSPVGRNRIRRFLNELNINDAGSYLSHWDSTSINYSDLKRKF